MEDYCNNPSVPENSCDNIYFSKTAVISTNCIGSLVAVSSLMIIVIVLRSTCGLSSVYHRIMFGMSTMELIGSVAKALATVPMPVDQMYPFSGSVLGTNATCEMQGFLALLGTFAPALYYCGLCAFYLCMIELRTSDRKIRKFLEPTVHTISLLCPLVMSTAYLLLSLINSTPHETWCSAGMYPWDCLALDGIECERGGTVSQNYVTIVSLVSACIIISAFLVVLICMSMIIIGACKKNEGVNNDWNVLKKALIQQSLMYIGVFMLLWTFRFAALFNPHPAIQLLRLICTNLQGLCTFLIFLFHKVYNLMRIESSLSVCQALKIIVLEPKDAPEIKLVGISMISRDNAPTSPDNGRVIVMPSIEEGVEDASKDMHLSYSASEEVTFMFDVSLKKKTTETEPKELVGSQFSVSNSQDLDAFDLEPNGNTSRNGKSQDIFNDSDISFSHDASTIKARNW